jgi:hypothetical protein
VHDHTWVDYGSRIFGIDHCVPRHCAIRRRRTAARLHLFNFGGPASKSGNSLGPGSLRLDSGNASRPPIGDARTSQYHISIKGRLLPLDRLSVRLIVMLAATVVACADRPSAHAFDFFGLWGSDEASPPISRTAISYAITVDIAGGDEQLRSAVRASRKATLTASPGLTIAVDPGLLFSLRAIRVLGPDGAELSETVLPGRIIRLKPGGRDGFARGASADRRLFPQAAPSARRDRFRRPRRRSRRPCHGRNVHG